MSVAEYIQALGASRCLGQSVKGYRFVEPQPAASGSLPPLAEKTHRLLAGLGRTQLYDHQVKALLSILDGHHTAICTPTASGKSLIYNVAFFDAFYCNPQVRALYLFPLKALAQDQLAALERWRSIDGKSGPTAAIYDGDTSAYRRARIRREPPNIVLTNPEMLHAALLPYHDRWRAFFEHLAFVVIDEMHSYRGLGGAHMAQVIVRLHRICDHYNARPRFILTSATVANPEQLATQLSGLQVHTIQHSGSAAGARHCVLIDTDKSPATTAILLMKAAIARNLRTIVYTQSRRMAELIAHWSQSQSGALAGRVSVYRAGLLPEERREVEQRLKDGRLAAVVSTSALELGIDIGSLDICILVGYPGSMISTLQRAGRVGRQGQESALIMIAAEDALDHYYITHPGAFFEGRPEATVVNPDNTLIVKAHLVCAAAEMMLDSKESWINRPAVKAAAAELEDCGALMRTADGKRLATQRRYPHRDVNLRGYGQRHVIVEADRETTIGEIDSFRINRETHPGAIYLHHGMTYRIEDCQSGRNIVKARRVEVDYHTRVRSTSTVTIIDTEGQKPIGSTQAYSGIIRVTEQVEGYDRIDNASGKVVACVRLALAPSVFETQALWFAVPAECIDGLSARDCDPLGSLHAAEHAAIGIMPLLVLADRNDVGGLSTLFHPQAGGAAIFIYDGIPGGAGLSRQAYLHIGELFMRAEKSIATCQCEKGCPACVHSPKCGSGNQPIDKAGAWRLLQKLQARDTIRASRANTSAAIRLTPNEPVAKATPPHYGVLDLETQFSAEEVGGWHLASRMRVSCGVVYDSRVDQYVTYHENQVHGLIDHLQQFDIVVGFNIRRFDYRVLAGHSDFDFDRLPTLDLLEIVRHQLGYRISLDHLARATLGASKCGSGLDALRWWRQKRIRELVEYCRQDVAITRDLYRYARNNGYLLFQDRNGCMLRIVCKVGSLNPCGPGAGRTSSRPRIPAGA